MSKNYENGIISATDGGSTDLSKDIEITGDVFWVDSVNGDNSNAGSNRNYAKSTLLGAINATTSNNGDIIIIESGHAETLTTAISITRIGLRIFGLGSGTSKPSFTIDAAIDGFSLDAKDCELNGLVFPVGTTIINTSNIQVNTAGCKIVNCDIFMGEFDTTAISIVSDNIEINGCCFTISADGADYGVKVENANVEGLHVIGCTFDGGSFDFDEAGIYSGFSHRAFLYRDNSLLNNASIIHTDTSATGQVVGTVANDGSRVEV